jgi:hypothetical protein
MNIAQHRSITDKLCHKNATALGIESGKGYFGASQSLE